MYGYVYLTKNSKNGLIYVGQHKGEFDPTYFGSGTLIRKAIKEFGVGSFSVSVLEFVDSRDELNDKERFYIAELNSRDREVWYNLAIGGEGAFGFSWSDEDKKRIGDFTRGGIFVNNGTEQRRVARDVLGDYLDAGYCVGKLKSTCDKISKSLLGRCVSTDTKKRLRDSICGRRWCNNGTEQRQVTQEDFDALLSDGWVAGMLPMSSGHRKVLSESLKGHSDTEETRKRKSEAQRIAWVRRKSLS